MGLRSGVGSKGFMGSGSWIGVKVSELVHMVCVQCQVIYLMYCDKIAILIRRCHF